MPKVAKAKDDRVYQLKVTLKDTKPPIWRRILARADTRLGDLHVILQVVMGWTDSHLHQFIAKGQYFGAPTDDGIAEASDEDEFTLGQVVRAERSKLVYEYDFGDGWMHDVLVEEIRPVEAKAKYPRCVDGKRACPPEDCGGVWGFYNMLEAVRDPKHPEHDDLVEWLGDEFDEEAFDLDAVNKDLSRLSKQSRAWRMFG